MNNVISCCGLVCSKCKHYPTECRGCFKEKGQAFWLKYTDDKVCSIYKCCVSLTKSFQCEGCSDCGACSPDENDVEIECLEEKMQDSMYVNEAEFRIIRLLGYGKGGYSYLVEKDGKEYVLKQIHHNPCDYYTFSNKIEAERMDYNRLAETGIRIPKMLDIDVIRERVLKEYVNGPTVYELVKKDAMKDSYLSQVKEMAKQAYSVGLNIDFFPTNFIVQDEQLYYIDFECNSYKDEWNFENWGVKYWSKTQEFLEYMWQE